MKTVLLMPKQQLGVVFEMRQFVSKHLRKPHHHHQKKDNPGDKVTNVEQLQPFS